MVNKYKETYNFNTMFKITYFLYMIRSMLLLFIYINNEEFVFSGMGIYTTPDSPQHSEGKRV